MVAFHAFERATIFEIVDVRIACWMPCDASATFRLPGNVVAMYCNECCWNSTLRPRSIHVSPLNVHTVHTYHNAVPYLQDATASHETPEIKVEPPVKGLQGLNICGVLHSSVSTWNDNRPPL
jgi:hypothetical protein